MTSREYLDPYVVLGVRRQASPEEIARAYRRAARATHPDRGGSGTGSEPFQTVSDAYEMLRDPGRRAGYDRSHPLPRQQPRYAADGSVRYAAPDSQHIVLGSRPPSGAGRRRLGLADTNQLRSVRGLGDIEEFFSAVLSLLRGS
jgi:curved DNA-binding protein CbpA